MKIASVHPHLFFFVLMAGTPVLSQGAGVPTTELASMDLPAIREKAESALVKKYPGTTPADFRFQYAYHKVEPDRPLNAVSLVSVFLRAKPVESRKEELGPMTKIVHTREQLWVEMETNGKIRRVSAKMLEQEEVVSKP